MGATHRTPLIQALLALLTLLPLFSHANHAPTRDWDHSANHYFALGLGRTGHGHEPAWIAETLGMHYLGPAGEIDGYHFASLPRSSSTDALIPSSPGKEPEPHLAEYLAGAGLSSPLSEAQATALACIHRAERQYLRRKQVSRSAIPAPPIIHSDPNDKSAHWAADLAKLALHDPGFTQQWHLHNYDNPGHDLNVTGIWAQGITGKGVVVGIIDDGLDYTSRDLKDNFDAEGSYDYNDHQKLPQPKLSDDLHGTRCAGEIAAVNNDVCGVGVAYNAKVAGIRILSGELTDADEALALNYGYQTTSIYSCSWGPPDDGQSIDAPNGIVRQAMLNGIEKGRGGKGSLFVFASGNGGGFEDNCNFDGYTNSIYSITIGAIDHRDQHPYYAEVCSAQLAVSYSSGSGARIYTTDVGENRCTATHGGTSAAAPLVAGIFALVLSVRPDLTWRDAQYLIVHTAIPVNDPGEGKEPRDAQEASWFTNGAGRRFSHMFGYGRVDAYAMVEEAKVWNLVGLQTWFTLPTAVSNRMLPQEGRRTPTWTPSGVNSSITVSRAEIDAGGIKSLEHVTVSVNIAHERRGDVQITLYSPHGSSSLLARTRAHDLSKNGFTDWVFTSVAHWGEGMEGDWILNVRDLEHPDRKGTFLNWTLRLWGEAVDPSFAKLPLHDGTLPKELIPSDDLIGWKGQTGALGTGGDPNPTGTAKKKPLFTDTSTPEPTAPEPTTGSSNSEKPVSSPASAATGPASQVGRILEIILFLVLVMAGILAGVWASKRYPPPPFLARILGRFGWRRPGESPIHDYDFTALQELPGEEGRGAGIEGGGGEAETRNSLLASSLPPSGSERGRRGGGGARGHISREAFDAFGEDGGVDGGESMSDDEDDEGGEVLFENDEMDRGRRGSWDDYSELMRKEEEPSTSGRAATP